MAQTDSTNMFFEAGRMYRCIKGVKKSFRKGKEYLPNRVDRFFAWFTNDSGEIHTWPQIDNIQHECELWNFKQEEIDPRLYFEPVL